MTKKRIIYILCPGHSGSTLMEYYLSTYKQSIGIGEAYKAIKNFQNDTVDQLSEYDQNMINNNPFWSKIYSRRDQFENIEEHYIDMYKYLIESEEFSEYHTIIDSTKNLEGLKALSKNYKDIIDVVIVYKDIRSWIISMIDTNIRKNRKIPLGYKYRLARKWWNTYNAYHDSLKKINMKYTNVSYDLFCLDHTKMKENIEEQLNLKGEPDLQNTNSINILGNRMKKSANTGLEIKYDYRWMQRNDWNLLWFLTPPIVKKFNRKWVWNFNTLIS